MAFLIMNQNCRVDYRIKIKSDGLITESNQLIAESNAVY